MYITPKENESYNDYIERIKDIDREGYTEKHHVLPKCCGGDNSRDNLVKLYPEEHFYAHLLLYKENPDIYGLAEAFLMMANVDGHDGARYNNKELAEKVGELKRAAAIKHGERIKGHEVSEYQRQRIKEANSHPRPDWFKEKQSEARQGWYQNGENPNAKKIYCKEKDKTYSCIKEFAEDNNINVGTVYGKIYKNKDLTEIYFSRKKITIILL